MKDENSCELLLSEGKLFLDEACLNVKNLDMTNTLDLWAQVEECYNCSSWKYLSLKPMTSKFLKVNSTYVTNIFIETPLNVCLHKYRYSFAQHGVYSMEFNSSHFKPITTLHQGDNEYTAILVSFLFFLFLYSFISAVKFLHYKMEERRLSRYERENRSLISEEVEPEIPNQSEAPVSPHQVSLSNRLNSLDTFRGIAIAMMIFVNYRGGKYYFFNHSPWNGLTFADLVFPWFMWIMGVSLTFSIKSQILRQASRFKLALKICKRSLILFLLGIIINSLKSNNLPNLRIFGVLQRFSLCYLINAILEVIFVRSDTLQEDNSISFGILDLLHSWTQWTIIGIMVIIHATLTFALKIPGCPTGYLGPGGIHAEGAYVNCTGGSTTFIDRFLLGENHMYIHPSCKNVYDCSIRFDPEGAFGVLTSCLTVQLGVLTGRIIHYYKSHVARLYRWHIWAIILGITGGFLCNWSKELGVIPVNKNLWSLSYVCVTASFAMFLFSFLYYSIDVKRKWKGGVFRVIGMNSILLYVGHEVTKNLVPWSWSPLPNSHSGILLMSIWGTCLWVSIAVFCHKKEIYITKPNTSTGEYMPRFSALLTLKLTDGSAITRVNW